MSRFVCCLPALLLIYISETAHAAQPTEEELSREALAGHLRTGNLEIIAGAMRGAKQRTQGVRTQFAAGAAARRAEASADAFAVVVFKHGVSESELAALADAYALDVLRVEIKAPQGDSGVVSTISLGPEQLLERSGTLAERLKLAIGHFRYESDHTAKSLTGADAEYQRRLAFGPLRIYKIESLAPKLQFARLDQNAAVLAVFISSNSQDAMNAAAAERLIQSSRMELAAPRRLSKAEVAAHEAAQSEQRAPAE